MVKLSCEDARRPEMFGNSCVHVPIYLFFYVIKSDWCSYFHLFSQSIAPQTHSPLSSIIHSPVQLSAQLLRAHGLECVFGLLRVFWCTGVEKASSSSEGALLSSHFGVLIKKATKKRSYNPFINLVYQVPFRDIASCV